MACSTGLCIGSLKWHNQHDEVQRYTVRFVWIGRTEVYHSQCNVRKLTEFWIYKKKKLKRAALTVKILKPEYRLHVEWCYWINDFLSHVNGGVIEERNVILGWCQLKDLMGIQCGSICLNSQLHRRHRQENGGLRPASCNKWGDPIWNIKAKSAWGISSSGKALLTKWFRTAYSQIKGGEEKQDLMVSRGMYHDVWELFGDGMCEERSLGSKIVIVGEFR